MKSFLVVVHYMVNTIVSNDLEMQGVMASAAISINSYTTAFQVQYQKDFRSKI